MDYPALVLLVDYPEGDFRPAGLMRDFGEKFVPRIVRLLAELQFSRLPDTWDTEVHVAPGERIDEVRAWLGARPVTVHAQLDAPLGERLAQVMGEALGRQGRPVILVRPDCPYCGPEELFAAARLLRERDAVFGPSTDGDFFLMGLSALPAGFFDDVNWGTNQVLFTLVSRWAATGRSYAMLDPLERVRDAGSWDRIVARLSPPGEADGGGSGA